MRIVGLILTGTLALSTPIEVHADPQGSNRNATNTTPVIGQRGNNSSISQSAPGFGGWQAAHDRGREWCPPHWAPNRVYGGWGSYGGRSLLIGSTFPGSAVFDDPFPDWRGPTGGWGNP
jgi:hypothetical protein